LRGTAHEEVEDNNRLKLHGLVAQLLGIAFKKKCTLSCNNLSINSQIHARVKKSHEDSDDHNVRITLMAPAVIHT